MAEDATDHPALDTVDGSPDLRVDFAWNEYDAGLFTTKLYRHIQRDELTFRLDARGGSLITSFAIGVAAGVTVEVATDLARYLLKRTRKAGDANRPIGETTLIVVADGVEHSVSVTDEADVEEVRRLARRQGEGDQATLDDF